MSGRFGAPEPREAPAAPAASARPAAAAPSAPAVPSAESVLQGLHSRQKTLSPALFYDAAGAQPAGLLLRVTEIRRSQLNLRDPAHQR